MNKVYFGFSNVHVAFMTEESKQGAPKYEDFVPIPGAVNFSPSADIDDYVFPADNIKYFVSKTANGYSGDLEVAKFPDEILTKALGWHIDLNGALVEVMGGMQRQFALAAQIEGDALGRRVIFYCCTLGTPSSEMSTIGNGMEVKTQTSPITIIPYDLGIDITGGRRLITKAQLEYSSESATAWNNFFEEPYMPTPAVIPPVTP